MVVSACNNEVQMIIPNRGWGSCVIKAVESGVYRGYSPNDLLS